MESYTITAQPNPAEHAVTLLLNGKFEENSLPDLEQSLTEARSVHLRVYLDLSEVTLVDRKAVEYISQQMMGEVRLINCPVYLWQWIAGGDSKAHQRKQ